MGKMNLATWEETNDGIEGQKRTPRLERLQAWIASIQKRREEGVPSMYRNCRSSCHRKPAGNSSRINWVRPFIKSRNHDSLSHLTIIFRRFCSGTLIVSALEK